MNCQNNFFVKQLISRNHTSIKRNRPRDGETDIVIAIVISCRASKLQLTFVNCLKFNGPINKNYVTITTNHQY